MTTALNAPLTVAELAAAVAGPVMEPGDPGYREETAAFNTAYTLSPAVVVGATGPADVAAAVRFADRTGRRVAVQSTGHGLAANLAGTVLVSTRRMTGVSIDPVNRTARVQAGVRWRAVIDAAAPYGLAPLNGSSSSVGVVGYTLGGGLGQMARKYGFAADHVRRFTIVTADGELRDVTPACEPELYWAVLGGKGNFGIVTDIEFELVPVARFYGGGIFFPASATAEVLHAWREWAPALPEEATTSVAMLRLPPDPALPEPLRGQFVTHVRFTHLGTAEAGAALIAPIRAVAEPVLDLIGELPYAAVDAVHMDPTDPMPVWDRGTGLAELPAAAVDAVLTAAGPAADVPLAMVEIRLLGGAIGRQPAAPNSVTGRDAAFLLFTLGVLAGPPVEVVAASAAAVIEAVRPWHRSGVLNLFGQAGPRRIGELWSDDDRTRLLRTRAYYDPAGLFASNIVIG